MPALDMVNQRHPLALGLLLLRADRANPWPTETGRHTVRGPVCYRSLGSIDADCPALWRRALAFGSGNFQGERCNPLETVLAYSVLPLPVFQGLANQPKKL